MRSTARRYLSLHTSVEKQANGAEDFDHLYSGKIDAYRAILGSTLPDIDKEPDRVAQEVLTLLVGGSATTMRVMLRIVYHVNSTPGVLNRLTKILDKVMTTPTVNPELEVLEKQEYLVSIPQPIHGPYSVRRALSLARQRKYPSTPPSAFC